MRITKPRSELAILRDELEAERAKVAQLEARQANPCTKIFEHAWLDPECRRMIGVAVTLQPSERKR